MAIPISLTNKCPNNEAGHEPEQINETDAAVNLGLGVQTETRLGEVEVCICKHCSALYAKTMSADS